MATPAVGSANAATMAVNSDIQSPGGVGGLLNQDKDIKEAQTSAKFGEVLKNIQAQYGAKPDKQREIKKVLGKDDFLRIMVTQMRHQDPSSPFKAEQMAAEMAQFTSVEQLQNLNQAMAKMTAANRPIERMATTGLIGKTVTVDRDLFVHTENEPSVIKYALPKDAKSVKAVVVSEQGEVVMEKDLGSQKAGAQEYTWDGIKKNTLAAKGGNYMFRLEARDDKDVLIPIDPKRRARVVGVAFEGNEAVLLIGDNKSQEKVSMKNVTRVEDLNPMFGAMPGMGGATNAAAGATTEGAPAAPTPNFFTFKKGEGSQTIDGSQVSPEVAGALAKYTSSQAANSAAEQAQAAAAAKATASEQTTSAPARKAEGFANGLSDNGDVDTSDIEKKLSAHPSAPTQPGAEPRQPVSFNELSRGR